MCLKSLGPSLKHVPGQIIPNAHFWPRLSLKSIYFLSNDPTCMSVYLKGVSSFLYFQYILRVFSILFLIYKDFRIRIVYICENRQCINKVYLILVNSKSQLLKSTSLWNVTKYCTMYIIIVLKHSWRHCFVKMETKLWICSSLSAYFYLLDLCSHIYASCQGLIVICWDTGIDLAFPLVSVVTLKALLVQDDEHPIGDLLHLYFRTT